MGLSLKAILIMKKHGLHFFKNVPKDKYKIYIYVDNGKGDGEGDGKGDGKGDGEGLSLFVKSPPDT